MEAFTDALALEGHAPLYAKKHATTVRAMVARGVKAGWLPRGFKPFDGVEGIKVPPKALLETDLPTREELDALFQAAKPAFAAMLTVYYHTGARTSELLEARVGDFQPQSRQIVLSKHKRSRTLREYRPRVISLNPDALAIIRERCRGRSSNAPIYPNRAGKEYTNVLIGDMFARTRKRAGVRNSITIYSYRHLWISEMLMAGHDALLVARMAGTSVKMIETVYGHFRTQSFVEAQARLDAARVKF